MLNCFFGLRVEYQLYTIRLSLLHHLAGVFASVAGANHGVLDVLVPVAGAARSVADNFDVHPLQGVRVVAAVLQSSPTCREIKIKNEIMV